MEVKTAQQGIRSKRSRGVRQAYAVATLLLLGVVVAGCGKGDAERRLEQRQYEVSRSEQVSLSQIVETFNHLYDRVNLEVEPPLVILDRRKTLDGEKALARFGRNPAIDDPPLPNYITITSPNTRLKALGVKPGDQVQYFIREVRDAFTEMGEEGNRTWTGQAEFAPVNMTVAQVVDDQHIIVDGGYPLVVDQDYEIQILRYVDDRSQDIREQLNAYAGYGSPLLAWQPSPDSGALENSLNLLSQSMRHTFKDSTGRPYEPPKLLETLPESIRNSARLANYLSTDALGHISFAEHEGRLLQQAVWLRNISNWARGDAVGDVELAEQLFDWTVRHIQLEGAEPEKVHHLARDPWEILLYGTGTAEQRAWVFANLCRQQGLPAVLLTATKTNTDGQAADKFWCAAILSQGEIYLFDPALGFPIPGVGGEGIATLTAAANDPGVLRQLDLDDEHRYPWSQEDLQHVEAKIVRSPLSLSRRAALLQERLVGQSAFVIADDPAPWSDAFGNHEAIQRVALWAWPFEVLDRQLAMGLAQNRNQRVRAALEFRVFAFEPRLWKARALHFRGPSEIAADGTAEEDDDAIDGHKEAIKLYQSAVATSWEVAGQQSDEKRQTMQAARENAVYWLGLLKMDQGLTESNGKDLEIAATSWFQQVLASKPPSAWLQGTRYNLARTYEALGRTEEAIELYEKDDSPQWYGNRLRSRWLRETKARSEQPAGS